MIEYNEMDGFLLEETEEVNEYLATLIQTVDNTVAEFDLRYLDVMQSYDKDVISEGMSEPVVAGGQLELCLNLLQEMGTGLAVLEGLYNQVMSLVQIHSERKTVEIKKTEAQRIGAGIQIRKAYMQAAIKNLEWRIPVLRGYVTINPRYGG